MTGKYLIAAALVSACAVAASAQTTTDIMWCRTVPREMHHR